MPSGPAVTAVGPWVADSSRPTCVECHTSFGFFTRRHHCRRCGEIFCGKCSKYASRSIPGLETHNGRSLRVCKCCFLRHLAYMVVARRTFGVKFEIFGSLSDATAYYNRCRRSRMLLSMANANVVSSHYETDAIRSRLQHKAQGARNFLLGGHQVAAALVRTDPLDHSRLSYTDSPVRTTPGAWTIVFVAQFGGGEWHMSVREMRGADERQRVVDAFMASAKAQKDVTKALVMNLRGLNVLAAHSTGVLTRTAAAVSEAQHFVRTQPCFLVQHVGGRCNSHSLATLSDGLDSLDQMPAECSAILLTQAFEVLARHRCDVPSFRDELLYYAGSDLLRTMHRNTRVAVVSSRDIVTVTTNLNTALAACESEVRTARALGGPNNNSNGGAAMAPIVAIVALQQEPHQFSGSASGAASALSIPSGSAATTPRSAAGAATATATAAPAPAAAGRSGALATPRTAAAGGSPRGDAPTSPTTDLAAGLKFIRVYADDPAAAARPVRAFIPAPRLAHAARLLADACRSSDEVPPPLPPPAQPHTMHSDAAVAAQVAAGFDERAAGAGHHHQPGRRVSPLPEEIVTCSICMEGYNGEKRRPVMCTSCGNTVCLECWGEIRHCPMCRGDKPPRPVVNIALLSLLTGDV